jgi:excisionase family DNA binding protein
MGQNGTVVADGPGLLTLARAIGTIIASAEATHTPAEAAALLRVDPSTVYRAIASGALKARRIGRGRGRLLIPGSALIEFQIGTPAAPAPASTHNGTGTRTGAGPDEVRDAGPDGARKVTAQSPSGPAQAGTQS